MWERFQGLLNPLKSLPQVVFESIKMILRQPARSDRRLLLSPPLFNAGQISRPSHRLIALSRELIVFRNAAALDCTADQRRGWLWQMPQRPVPDRRSAASRPDKTLVCPRITRSGANY